MKIIISPAKKMKLYEGYPLAISKPILLNKSKLVLKEMQKLSFEELQIKLKCNHHIASLAYDNYLDFSYDFGSAAILTYDGIQYTYMQAKVFSQDEYSFLQQHLVILSAFYGLVRPLDEIKPYRLEMETKIKINEQSLYEFWGEDIAKFFDKEEIINLASEEYSKVVKDYAKDNKIINVYFYENVDGKLIEKGVYCKMARGMMVRYIAENQINEPEALKHFNLMGYCFNASLSNEENYIFERIK